MKVAAVICNIVLFAFTCLVITTDGPPTGAAYIVFNLWLLGTLVFNAVVVSRRSATATTRVVGIVCNVVLLGFICWAFVDQYPHPEEEGFLAFMVLIVLTPILSLATLLRGGSGDGWLRLHLKSKVS